MTEFNLWTFNSRVFPALDPLVARTGDKVRIRVGNLTMTNHPIHLHGHTFEVTGTDGGWVPKTARWPEVTTDVAVGQMRAVEFTAVAGDWAFHCHKSHHTMNAMGHKLPTMIGVPQQEISEKIRKLVPDYMAMGSKGMADMSDMAMMPLPDNTLPMMGGTGPFGALEMGGMFTVLKVRDNQAKDDYCDPGWYDSPKGTTAWLYEGEEPEAVRAESATSTGHDLQVRKPTGHSGH
jgi:hypothetical protein